MSKVIIENFKHSEGGHCESTTMRDLIEHAGIPISEPMEFGLDATMGFICMDNTKKVNEDALFNMDFPIFAGGKQGTITEDSLACRILGLVMKSETFKDGYEAWNSSKGYLGQGIPLGIKADMAYLPYFDWPEGEEIHFGSHAISLVGFDDEKQVALVCDNDHDEIQEVSIEMLMKARSSTHGSKFLHPRNFQFRINKRPDGKKPPFARAVKLAIQQVAKSMVAPSMNYLGLSGIQVLLKSIPEWSSKLGGKMKDDQRDRTVSAAYLTFEGLYGFIEEYGTGGAIFRNLYVLFLEELGTHPDILSGPHAWTDEEKSHLAIARDSLSESAKGWTNFASQLKSAMDKGGENCLEYVELNELSGIVENILEKEETSFETLIKITL
ncbi:MAG: BtrH N-terminal domain-containing protein [Candidatus Hodarchaeota archaeon]